VRAVEDAHLALAKRLDVWRDDDALGAAVGFGEVLFGKG
jgi:hypothetical protein